MLTQLTKLDFQYSNTAEGGYEALSALTQLKDLTLRFGDDGGDDDEYAQLHSIGPFLPPYTLDRLSVQGFTKAQKRNKVRITSKGVVFCRHD